MQAGNLQYRPGIAVHLHRLHRRAEEVTIAISMDRVRGETMFFERLWRSIKYEEVYLHAYKTVSEARAGIARYLNFYNTDAHMALLQS
ncbi:Putative transposase (identified by ISEscan HMM) [Klebsiella pneumoniae]|nr:Putative transposase (identified by ISEscan HMM) [Klebsiella pneumoniae]